MGSADDVAVDHQGQGTRSLTQILRHRTPLQRARESVTISGVDQGSHVPEGWRRRRGSLAANLFGLLTCALQGSTNNMAHPALAALVTDFFYSPSSLNSVYPEIFSREAPKVAVCLASTAV